MLTKAIEAEVQAYLAQHEHCRDEKGHRLVGRNGTLPGRTKSIEELIPWLYFKGISTGDLTEVRC